MKLFSLRSAAEPEAESRPDGLVERLAEWTPSLDGVDVSALIAGSLAIPFGSADQRADQRADADRQADTTRPPGAR